MKLHVLFFSEKKLHVIKYSQQIRYPNSWHYHGDRDKGRLFNYGHMLEPFVFMPRNFSRKIMGMNLTIEIQILSEILSRRQTNFAVHKLIRISFFMIGP